MNQLALSPAIESNHRYHPDAHSPDLFASWIADRFRALASTGASPLLVPITATFKPASIRQDEVLQEFGRFYARLCSLLVRNHERAAKRHLLPFAIAWRDDPRTRPDKYRARPARYADFMAHPHAAPHVHGVLLIHPQLVDRFLELVGELERVWRGMLTCYRGREYLMQRNGTLHVDLAAGRRLSDELASSARSEGLARWVSYSSKLGQRWDAGEGDLYVILPGGSASASRTGLSS